jgi:hypothetical protein
VGIDWCYSALSVAVPVATNCTNSDRNDEYFYISTQKDLDSYLANTTIFASGTLCSSLYVWDNFTGPLDLKGISLINGSIITGDSTLNFNDERLIYSPGYGLTSLKLDDLLHVNKLWLNNLDHLESLSAQRLETAEDIVLYAQDTTTLDLPSLRNITMLSLYKLSE